MKVLLDENIPVPFTAFLWRRESPPPPVIPDPDRESIPGEAVSNPEALEGSSWGGGPGTCQSVARLPHTPFRHSPAPEPGSIPSPLTSP